MNGEKDGAKLRSPLDVYAMSGDVRSPTGSPNGTRNATNTVSVEGAIPWRNRKPCCACEPVHTWALNGVA